MITDFKSSVDVHSLNEKNLSGVAIDSISKDRIAGLISMYPNISHDDLYEIIEAYRPLIISSIKRFCPISKEFSDLYNDGVVYLIESLSNFDPNRGFTFGAYIKSGLRIYYLDTLRYLMRYADSPDVEDYMAASDSLEDDFFKDKDYASLYDAIGSLNSREREVIFLNFYKGFSLSEIARELGISLRTVNRVKQAALDKMKEFLKEA